MRILALFLALCLPAVAQAEGYRPGDIFVTRNALEADNTSPGYWNHLGIYVGHGLVVEAQAEPNAVIYSDLAEFIARYPEILVLRFRDGGAKMAEVARSQVGTPYWRLASVPFVLRPAARGDNCVSAVRRARVGAGWRDPRWRKPDDAVGDPSLQIRFTKR